MDDRTIGKMFFSRAERYGSRTLFKVKRDGQYRDISWADTSQAVKEFALWLLDAGVNHGDRVALLSENRPEWATTDLAILSIGAVDVPIYATNTPKQVEYIINNSSSRILVVSNEKQLKKALEVRPNCASLEKIVIFDEIGPTDYPMVCTFKEVRAKGCQSGKDSLFKQRLDAIKPEELASIIYTSGTTGDPKGVMLTHDNFLANCRSVKQILPITEEDTCLSFLPLSHSFERMAGYYVPIYQGITIAYAESIDTVRDNLKEIRPTFMASVPRIYEKFHAAVLENVKSGSPTKQKIFDWSFRVGREMSGYKVAKKSPPAVLNLKYKLADALVFKKIKENVGGRLRYFVSGGAPLAQEINAPDGEILAKGPNIMVGYFNKPEDTTEAIDKEGFFHTGDIGVLDENGFLKITDRKKDIIVTAGGKNIAPQNIENLLKTDPLVANVMVHGDKRKFISALIVPEFEKLKQFAAEKGIKYGSMSELVKDERVVKLIGECVAAANRELASYESIKKFAVMDKDFTLESGELTPTLKVKRKVVTAKYKDTLDSFYKE
ncbi:MAG: long-chain fatty acid--CoA ligase [Candidatus Lindowbacteria bacterium]|nr:long-chain fatty acid--CoA ligase [Candidatus Lindowbacteria bacterium]